MASYRAVATGNWSSTATWNVWSGSAWVSTSVVPSSNDDVWANSFTITIDQNVTVLTLRNSNTGAPGTGTVSNGGFVVSGNGLTVICSSSNGLFVGGGSTLLTISGSGTNTFNINLITTVQTGSVPAVLITSTGVVNWTGDVFAGGLAGSFVISSAVTLNFIGNIRFTTANSSHVTMFVNAVGYIINITGDIGFTTGGSSNRILQLSNTGTLNVTGNIIGHSTLSIVAIVIDGGSPTVNITGSVIGNEGASCINSTVSAYIKIIGTITATNNQIPLINSGVSSTTILSGPLVSSPHGRMPFFVPRLFIIQGSTTSLELASDSTNGALPPNTVPTRFILYTPNTIVDAPAASNVRQGTVYALGSQTGTLAVPIPSNVRLSIPTDNTVGTGQITAQDLFTVISTSSEPLALRLRNVATVESVGNQIASL
jgi:hypothetical protein